jgi:hypothetical protein
LDCEKSLIGSRICCIWCLSKRLRACQDDYRVKLFCDRLLRCGLVFGYNVRVMKRKGLKEKESYSGRRLVTCWRVSLEEKVIHHSKRNEDYKYYLQRVTAHAVEYFQHFTYMYQHSNGLFLVFLSFFIIFICLFLSLMLKSEVDKSKK